jgi:DNA-binding CsgD family transcriptional regulator
MDSGNLEQRDEQNLLVEAKGVFDICDLDEFRLSALDILMRQIDAERGSFLILDGSDLIPNKQYAVSRGVDDNYLNQYRRYYHHLNPFAKKRFDPDKIVLTTEDVTTFKRLQRTEYYNDFLKPQSIHYQLVIMLLSGGRTIGAASLYRPKDSHGFSLEEKNKAGLLSPFISVGLMKNLAVTRMNIQNDIIEAIVSGQPDRGIIIIDENFTAVHYNEKAVNTFKTAKIKSFNPLKPLEAFPPELRSACKECLLCSSEKPEEDFSIPKFMIDLHSKYRMVAHVHKICGDHNRHFIMIHLEPEESINSLNQILSDIGLTPREVELSNLLIKGLKNNDISKKLFISEYTVQNHLKSIYRKMKVKNRTSLIYRCIQLTSEDTSSKNSFH